MKTNELGLTTRVPATPWNQLMTRFREKAELSKYALARKVAFKMQPAQFTRYEAGTQCPSVARFVQAIEACGGVVIVRKGTEEYQVIAEFEGEE